MGLRSTDKARIGEPKDLERSDGEGEIPVGEVESSEVDPEYRGTREILWEAGGTTPQA